MRGLRPSVGRTREFYAPSSAAARLFTNSVRSDFSTAPRASLIARRTSFIAARTSLSATLTSLIAARVPFLQPLHSPLQRVLPSLQDVLPLLQRLQRRNTPCNKASPSCNDATTRPRRQQRPAKAPPAAPTLPFARLSHRPLPSPPYIPSTPPATPPRATVQVAPALFRHTATQSARKSQAPLRREQ
jgi:hypothetical protein